MMGAQDYGVRVKVAYLNFRKGQVIYPPGLLRDQLVAKGFCERLSAPVEDLTPAPPPTPAPKMVDTLQRRRRTK